MIKNIIKREMKEFKLSRDLDGCVVSLFVLVCVVLFFIEIFN